MGAETISSCDYITMPSPHKPQKEDEFFVHQSGVAKESEDPFAMQPTKKRMTESRQLPNNQEPPAPLEQATPSSVNFQQSFLWPNLTQQSSEMTAASLSSTPTQLAALEIDESQKSTSTNCMVVVWIIITDTTFQHTCQDIKNNTQYMRALKHKEQKKNEELVAISKQWQKQNNRERSSSQFKRLIQIGSASFGILGGSALCASGAVTGNIPCLLQGGKMIVGSFLSIGAFLLEWFGYDRRVSTGLTGLSVVLNIWGAGSSAALFEGSGLLRHFAVAQEASMNGLKTILGYVQTDAQKQKASLAEKQNTLTLQQTKSRDEIQQLSGRSNASWGQNVEINKCATKQLQTESEIKARIINTELI